MNPVTNALYTPGAIGNAIKRTGNNGQGLEPDEGQLSCPVLRGLEGGNTLRLPGGLTTYLTGSDGTAHQAPQPLQHSLNALAQVNRRLAGKKKGAHNRKPALANLARVHTPIANQRQAFHGELAHALCKTYDVIALETLSLSGMKALWGRKVSALGFATFVETLHSVASTTGTIVQHIGKWFPSTKLCSACGCVNQAITLRDRVWICPDCGITHQRDPNAAVNIFREGASAHGGNHVSQASAGVDC